MIKKSLIGTVGFLVGVLTALALLELVLRFLPVNKDVYGAEPEASWPAHHMIPNTDYTFSAGWDLENVRHGHINNMGYTAPFDYRPGTSAIVVEGDSFIESLMNDYAESLQGILPSLLSKPVPVLGFGTSAASLAHDIGVAALIGKQFKATWAVVLVTRGNFIGGFNYAPGFFRWTSRASPGIELIPEQRHSQMVRVIRNLAVVRYVRGNLRADLANLLLSDSKQTTAACKPVTLSMADRGLVNFTAEQLPVRFNLPPARVILIFDADRQKIYKPGAVGADGPCPTRDALARSLLAHVAAEHGIGVINMEPIFRTEFQRTGEHFDYLPTDSHWNGTAHGLAAREVARYINNSGATSPLDSALHETSISPRDRRR